MDGFDSLFDTAMRDADAHIMDRMSSPFILQLRGGGEMAIHAIYDTELAFASGKPDSQAPRPVNASCEHGVLTVLNQRLDREIIAGANVQTPQGKKVVGAVFYQDRTTTIIILTVPGGAKLPEGAGVRFTRP
ncbi:hypothetical protein [Buttiauxella sp. A111]|uniref:hypothetical protein n=1 Tax=Buttiauxella sp. A111 TaxID=2563088 RepID=UPI0010DC6249|nr:hypothetical protein [Buttiauxella sp. A111]GDX06643.1 hypothetical protein BSPA111_28540 [Buttiauxella sp. A111]